MWFGSGLCHVMLMVGPNDLERLSQPERLIL